MDDKRKNIDVEKIYDLIDYLESEIDKAFDKEMKRNDYDRIIGTGSGYAYCKIKCMLEDIINNEGDNKELQFQSVKKVIDEIDNVKSKYPDMEILMTTSQGDLKCILNNTIAYIDPCNNIVLDME